LKQTGVEGSFEEEEAAQGVDETIIVEKAIRPNHFNGEKV
jgi:hypothetical protein